MNKTIEELLNRKSLRSFSNKAISKVNKKLILESAFAAPSAGNMQLYSIIDVTDQKVKDKLSILCDNQPFIKDAKIVLVFVADYYKWQNAFLSFNLKPRNIAEGDMLLAIEDALIAAQNAVVAAESLGIGSCYIGDIMENYEEVVKLLNLPNNTYPACMVVFGYPNKTVINRQKPKRFKDKYVVFENKYQKLNSKDFKSMFDERTKGNNKEWLSAFMKRKHNSDFSKEMQRSAKLYIKHFKQK